MGEENTSSEDINLEKKIKLTLYFAGFLLFILPASYIFWWGSHTSLPKNITDPSAWGSFGDFFGGILNPIVAFFALLWLTRSIQIQRTELKETKAIIAEQSKTLEKQRFEDTFFALLDQHNKVLEGLSSNSSTPASLNNISGIHKYTFTGIHSLGSAHLRISGFDDELGHYFRILYHTFKLIATNAPGSTLGEKYSAAALLRTDPSDEEKKYASIARAFLGTKITQLLSIHCYCTSTEHPHWNFKCLIERYGLLEHMPFTIDKEEHSALRQSYSAYGAKAFGNSEFVPILLGHRQTIQQ